jgi:hypothetical protein
MMTLMKAVLLTVSVAVFSSAAACDRSSGNSTTPTTGNPTPVSAGGGDGDETPAEVDVDKDKKQIIKAVAKLLKVPDKGIEVDLPMSAQVPGITVYKARATSIDPIAYSVGIVHKGKVISDRAQALRTVAAAWGYGQTRSVPAATVAGAFGILEGANDAWRPILDQDDLDILSENRRKIVFLPRETTVDGKPAVQYWVKSAEPPLWMTTAIFEPDGSVTLSREEHAVF